jgi:hypothetical protein
LNPSSPGFSGSKSYNAVQHGPTWGFGVFAGERIGDGSGDAVESSKKTTQKFNQFTFIFTKFHIIIVLITITNNKNLIFSKGIEIIVNRQYLVKAFQVFACKYNKTKIVCKIVRTCYHPIVQKKEVHI